MELHIIEVQLDENGEPRPVEILICSVVAGRAVFPDEEDPSHS